MLAIIALAIFAGLSYKKPVWGLSALVASSPLYLLRFTILGVPTTFLEIIIVVFLLITAYGQRGRFSTLLRLGKFNWLVAAFALAGIIATIVSPETVKAMGQLKAFIFEPILLFYAACLIVKVRDEAKPIVFGMAWSVIVVSAFGLIQKATHFLLPLRFWGTGEEPLRIVSFFEYPNALALYLAPLLGLLIAAALMKPVFINKTFLWTAILLGSSSVVLTFSRGAWLGILAGALLVLSKHFTLKKTLAAGGLAIALLVIIPQTRQRTLNTFNDSSSGAHLDLLKAGTDKLLSNPFLGNGLYGFRSTLKHIGFQGEILNYPHNILLNFWLELGLLGLISFAGIISYFLFNHKRSSLGIIVAAFMLVLVVHGLFDVPYFKNDLAVLFWVTASLFFTGRE